MLDRDRKKRGVRGAKFRKGEGHHIPNKKLHPEEG
jgi:hypothetical protein